MGVSENALLLKYRNLPVQVKASIWFMLAAFVQRGISVITTPIFTRLMSTEEYGTYGVFNSWLNILTVIVSMDLFYGVYSQGLVKFEERRREYSSSLSGLTSVLVIVWAVIYSLFSEQINSLISLDSFSVYAILILIWTNAMFNFWALDQRVDFLYKKLIVVSIVVSVLNPCLSIYLIHVMNNKVHARILGLLFIEIIIYAPMFFITMNKGKKFYSGFFWKYALRFNIVLIPHYLSSSILSSADKIMIEHMVDNSKAGIYSLAYSISQILTIVNIALMQTLEPWIFKKIKANEANKISSVAYLMFMFVIFVNLLLILLAPEVIAFFAPKSYYEAIYIIPPVAFSVYFMFLYNVFGTFEFYYEKTNYITLATVIGAVLNIVLNYIFIYKFGYLAAGYTTLVCYIVYAFFHYLMMKKVCKDNLTGQSVFSSKVVMLISVVCGILCIGFSLLYDHTIARYSIASIILVICFVYRQKIIEQIKGILKIKKE